MRYLITTAEAAALIGIKPTKLGMLRFHWKGPPFFKLGGSVLYDREELLKWFKAGRREPSRMPALRKRGARKLNALSEANAARRREANAARSRKVAANTEAHATA